MSSGYMRKLFIEVLKIVAKMEYDILDYQFILDLERNYYNNLKDGIIINMNSDEEYGNEIRRIFNHKLNIVLPIKTLRDLFNSVFFKNGNVLLLVFSDDEGKSVSKESMTDLFIFQKFISKTLYNEEEPSNLSINFNILYITKNDLTPSNKTWINSFNTIKHFKDIELICRPLENVFSSVLENLKDEKKQDFISKLPVNPSKIPKISRNLDILGRLGDKKDIHKYYRESLFPESINEKSITYRYIS